MAKTEQKARRSTLSWQCLEIAKKTFAKQNREALQTYLCYCPGFPETKNKSLILRHLRRDFVFTGDKKQKKKALLRKLLLICLSFSVALMLSSNTCKKLPFFPICWITIFLFFLCLYFFSFYHRNLELAKLDYTTTIHKIFWDILSFYWNFFQPKKVN